MNLKEMILARKEDIAMALPRHLTPERMIRTCLTAVNKTPKLRQCDPNSVIMSIIEASQLGQEPDGILGHGYLIPYGNICQFQIGYRGLMDLAYRSGRVTLIYAEVVYDKDRYKVTKGLHPSLEHEPTSDPNHGPLVASYAVVHLKDSPQPAFVWLWKYEIDEIRKRSKAANSGPWVTDYSEMAKKTAIRRIAKTIPLSPEFVRAAMKSEYMDTGVLDLDSLPDEPKQDLTKTIKELPEPAQELKGRTEEWDKDGFNEVLPKEKKQKRIRRSKCKDCSNLWLPDQLEKGVCPDCLPLEEPPPPIDPPPKPKVDNSKEWQRLKFLDSAMKYISKNREVAMGVLGNFGFESINEVPRDDSEQEILNELEARLGPLT